MSVAASRFGREDVADLNVEHLDDALARCDDLHLAQLRVELGELCPGGIDALDPRALAEHLETLPRGLDAFLHRLCCADRLFTLGRGKRSFALEAPARGSIRCARKRAVP